MQLHVSGEHYLLPLSVWHVREVIGLL